MHQQDLHDTILLWTYHHYDLENIRRRISSQLILFDLHWSKMIRILQMYDRQPKFMFLKYKLRNIGGKYWALCLKNTYGRIFTIGKFDPWFI